MDCGATEVSAAGIAHCKRLASLFAEPQKLDVLSVTEWDTLIRIARRGNTLGKLAECAQHTTLNTALPGAIGNTLQSALTLSHRQERAIRWEIQCLRDALADADIPLVLLKGAAYLARGIPAAKGRLYSDVDILVPLERISDAESSLMKAGWASTHHDAYDQRYYREWMHEIPPMKHWRRGTVVDVHHRILPRTAQYDPDPKRMLAAADPVGDMPGVFTLSAIDMLLHSATHLFHEGELPNGFRDLLDIDALYRRLAALPDFPASLHTRAKELELTEPLALALRYAHRLLGTPSDKPAGSTPRQKMLDWMYLRALHPHHPLLDTAGAPAARLGLYIRAHWLRMPPHLLARHLGRKAWMRLFPEPDPQLEKKEGP